MLSVMSSCSLQQVVMGSSVCCSGDCHVHPHGHHRHVHGTVPQQRLFGHLFTHLPLWNIICESSA